MVDRHHLVGPVLAKPAGTAGEVDVLHARAPAEHRLDRLDLDVHLEAGQPGQLLPDDGGLEVALVGGLDVLEVAATTGAGSGVGARRGHAVRRGLEHLDRVAAQEPVALTALGDLDDHPLARERVPDEHDDAGLDRLDRRESGHHVPPVRDRDRDDLVPLACA